MSWPGLAQIGNPYYYVDFVAFIQPLNQHLKKILAEIFV